MRIGDALYFAPNRRFAAIDFNDHTKLVDGFVERMRAYYFEPAQVLREHNHAFAKGLVCCALIDCLAQICRPKREIYEWIEGSIASFRGQPMKAKQFWGCFRQGLAHGGRIMKHGRKSWFGQFSFELSTNLWIVDGDVMIVNPELLLTEIRAFFDAYFDRISGGDLNHFVLIMKAWFEDEVHEARSV